MAEWKFSVTCERCGTVSIKRDRGKRFCSRHCAYEFRKIPEIDRFRSKVKTVGPNECALWMASTCKDGYGQFQDNARRRRLSHRYAWELANGPIPERMYVLHRCDNPPCCNVRHLFLGTAADNAADREAKGRGNQAKGEKSGPAKISEKTARRVLEMPGSHSEIAASLGMSRENVRSIKRRRTWRHLNESQTPHPAERPVAVQTPSI